MPIDALWEFNGPVLGLVCWTTEPDSLGVGHEGDCRGGTVTDARMPAWELFGHSLDAVNKLRLSTGGL